MGHSTVEDDLRKQLVAMLPVESNVTNITYEGPFLVVYSKNPKVLMEDGEIVKNLARMLRKRILIKSDHDIRMPKDQAEKIIREIVPTDAEITAIAFDDDMGDIVIEAKKPGIVIGKNGSTLRELVKAVFWRPTVVRTPPLTSSLIQNIRRILQQHSATRQAALVSIGQRIHRRLLSQSGGWLRLTALGGFREVGRTCLLLETHESKVMIDCGVNVGSSSPTHMFPRLDLPEFDAIIITHAHLDHCLPPDTPIKLADGQWKPIQEINEGESVLSMNWITGDFEPAKCVGKTITHGHKEIIEVFTPYLNQIASPNHRFFTVKNMEIVEVEAQDLEKDMLLPAHHSTFNSDIDTHNRISISLKRTIDYQGRFPLTQEMRSEFRKYRLEKKLKQSDVASITGVHRNAISLYETNKDNISFPVLQRLVNLYDVSWDEFVKKHGLPQLPQTLTPELARLVGYIQGDGFKSGEHSFRIIESDTTVVKSYVELIKELFGIDPIIRPRSDTETPTFTIEVNNSYILRFLELNFSTIFSKSRHIELPTIIGDAPNNILCSYIRGLFDAEGSVITSSQHAIKFCSFSSKLLKKLQVILYRLGMPTSLYLPDYTLSISTSYAVIKFAELIGFTSLRKMLKLQDLVEISNLKSVHYLHNLVPISSNDVRQILTEIGIIGRTRKGPRLRDLPAGILDMYRRGSGYGTRSTITKLVELLNSRYESLEFLKEELDENMITVRQQLSIRREDLASITGLSVMQVQYREEKHCLEDEITETIRTFLIDQIIRIQEYIINVIAKTQYLLSLDIKWQLITRIEKHQNKVPLIDIEVNPNRNFIANNLIVHNSGFAPFLYKYGYRGPLYCTEPTRNLMTLLQIDYLEVANREGKLSPYSFRNIQEELIHTIPLKYGEVTDIAPDIRLTFHNAGHILGSAIVHLHLGEGVYNVAFAHDFKYAKSRLLDPANSRFPRIETLIMESTYGGPRDIVASRKESERQLVKIINETINRRGKVLIPVLSVGRAQELMIVLDELIRRKLIPEIPIYLDGMIGEATSIHTCHPEYLSANLRERIFHAHENPFLSEWFAQVDNQNTRDEIAESGSCVIMATSGMLAGGPSVEHFRLLAPNEKNSIIFVSYQADRTLGRRIQNGAKEIQMVGPTKKTQLVRVNMDIHTSDGFSGHSDRRMLLNYLRRISPKPEKVVLIHGEESKMLALANTIRRSLRAETLTPRNLETIRMR
ncbi:MAG: beta-CASP ribonuclease aCPSF1 [Candidatus Kariarchaeaceae archaeon]|jgi:predicted metal-dependent RNase/transcriptional regulator with XRE-family HTH domain